MYEVYILKSMKDQRTYTGYAENAHDRLKEHNRGKVAATRNRRPLEILHIERCDTLGKAKQREQYWKSGGGRRKLRIFFRRGFPPSQD